MRISDWSSDVCSSDLARRDRDVRRAAIDHAADRRPVRFAEGGDPEQVSERVQAHPALAATTLKTARPSPLPRASRGRRPARRCRSEEHTSELQSLMRISYAVFCSKKTKNTNTHNIHK